jgi:hypothetical protein
MQPVMTLARQMYPSNSQLFMKQFEEATQHPCPEGFVFVNSGLVNITVRAMVSVNKRQANVN